MIKVFTQENKTYTEIKGARIILTAQVVALLRDLLKDNPEIVHAAFLLLEAEMMRTY